MFYSENFSKSIGHIKIKNKNFIEVKDIIIYLFPVIDSEKDVFGNIKLLSTL